MVGFMAWVAALLGGYAWRGGGERIPLIQEEYTFWIGWNLDAMGPQCPFEVACFANGGCVMSCEK